MENVLLIGCVLKKNTGRAGDGPRDVVEAVAHGLRCTTDVESERCDGACEGSPKAWYLEGAGGKVSVTEIDFLSPRAVSVRTRTRKPCGPGMDQW